MALGTGNMKTTTIARHLKLAEHRQAVLVPRERENVQAAVNNVVTKEESGILNYLKVVYWMAKESVPLSKYPSLIELLKDLGTPHLDSIECGERRRVTYESYNSACDFLDSLSTSIDTSVTAKLTRSPTITILTDESTDIAAHHKLCITARVIDPISMMPSTMFLTDL
jgi:hypothetical protein